VPRTLRSDLVFVRLPGPLPWGTFRDVYEVDGQKVRDRERRLEKLFFAPKASDYEQAEAILNESSRYNLGQAYRNINVPTLGLLFLRPENQQRLAFKRKGTRTVAGLPTVEVAFEEKASPTLVHDRSGNDVPASGRFWIDESRGTVLRTEIKYDLETNKAMRSPDAWERGLVSTEYRRETHLECFVPDTMTEVYNFRGIGRIDGVARYASYRRFQTSVGPITYGQATAGPEPSASAEPPAPPARAPAPRELEMRAAPEGPRSVGGLLQKAGDYVLRYEQAFRNVVAEERYEHRSSAPADPNALERVRSEVVFAMLPGRVPWTLLRDVLEVGGRVRRETGRLEPLFRASAAAGLREAEAISRESEKRRAGPVERTLAVPTTALAYLRPDNRDAFRFDRKGAGEVRGQATVEIAFEEVERPTLNQGAAGGDLPARGTFWIRESDGAVLRSRTVLDLTAAGVPGGGMTVVTEYRDDPGMGVLVPAEMQERIEWAVERATSAAPPGVVEATSRYSGFHRAETAP
jgi:hypothetical protein